MVVLGFAVASGGFWWWLEVVFGCGYVFFFMMDLTKLCAFLL